MDGDRSEGAEDAAEQVGLDHALGAPGILLAVFDPLLAQAPVVPVRLTVPAARPAQPRPVSTTSPHDGAPIAGVLDRQHGASGRSLTCRLGRLVALVGRTVRRAPGIGRPII